jgi:hypothetical protein
MDTFKYPDPIQGGDEKVTRQRGITPEDIAAREREEAARYLPEIVQPGGDLIVTRQTGLQYTDSTGVLVADRPIEDAVPIFVADRAIAPDVDAGFPGKPGVVPGVPAAQPPAVDVVASDQRAPGQQVEGAPQVITPEQVAAAKAAAKKAKQ